MPLLSSESLTAVWPRKAQKKDGFCKGRYPPRVVVNQVNYTPGTVEPQEAVQLPYRPSVSATSLLAERTGERGSE